MRTVSVSELGEQLGGLLQAVREGEEVLVQDAGLAVARISPVGVETRQEKEARLVAEGKIRLPRKEMDWAAFDALPAGKVSYEDAVQALIESRGDR